jgi:hypothetical protein
MAEFVSPAAAVAAADAANTAPAAPFASRFPTVDAAATRIQASYRGHRGRRAASDARIPPHHFPHRGPLGSVPPAKPHPNPILVLPTRGREHVGGCASCCGDTRAANACCAPHAFHFGSDNRDGPVTLSPRLEGIYTEQEWHALVHELDGILRNSYLPLCPAGLLCFVPVLGAITFMCWSVLLQERRLPRLVARIDAENRRLHPFGLWWALVPVVEHTLRGRKKEESGYILQLLYGKMAARASAPPGAPADAIAASLDTTVLPTCLREPVASLPRIWRGPHSPALQPPPPRERMTDEQQPQKRHHHHHPHLHHHAHGHSHAHQPNNAPLTAKNYDSQLIQVVPASR